MFNLEVGMNELILVRHGESQYNAFLTDHLDSDLTPEGIEQARKTAKFLKEHFGHLQSFVGITSPYRRCLHTSKIIREETGLEFRVHTGPREIMLKYVEAEVKNHQEHFPDFLWNHNHDLVFKMETVQEYINRMIAFHKDIREDKVFIVSHGTPVNTIFELTTGQEAKADTVNYVKNCAISYARNGEGIWFGKVVY